MNGKKSKSLRRLAEARTLGQLSHDLQPSLVVPKTLVHSRHSTRNVYQTLKRRDHP